MRHTAWLSILGAFGCGGDERAPGSSPDASVETDARSSDAGADGGPACPECTALVGGRLFDGTEARTGTLVLRDGLIDAVLPEGEPHGAGNEIDVAGQTVLPGLFDLHVHTSDPGGPMGFFAPDRFLEEHLKALLRAGVTTFLDLGNDRRIAFELRDRIRRGEVAGPDMLAVGSMITVTGGHPCYPGMPVGGVCLLVDSVDAVPRIRAELVPYGPDALKVPLDASQGLPSLDLDVLAAIAAIGDEQGIPVFAHVAGELDVEQALDAGIRAFAHIPMYDALSPALLDRLAAEGAAIIPTLAVNESLYDLARGTDRYEDPSLEEDVPAEVLEALRAAPPDLARRDRMASRREIAFENLERAREAGVRIVTGTDAGIWGSLHGHSLHDEIVLLVEHTGATAAEALAAATSEPAALLGLADRGRLAAGLRADLVIVQGDPLDDIDAIRRVTAVFRAGEAVDRDALAIGGGASLVRPPAGNLAAGATCLFASECDAAAGLVCDRWYGLCVGTCTFPSSDGCIDGVTACSPQNTCAPGDACDPWAQDCENGAACSWIGNGATACWPASRREAGAPCENGGMCAPGNQCDFTTGVCYGLCDPGSEGSGCDEGESCHDLETFAEMSIGQCT